MASRTEAKLLGMDCKACIAELCQPFQSLLLAATLNPHPLWSSHSELLDQWLSTLVTHLNHLACWNILMLRLYLRPRDSDLIDLIWDPDFGIFYKFPSSNSNILPRLRTTELTDFQVPLWNEIPFPGGDGERRLSMRINLSIYFKDGISVVRNEE